MHRVSSWEQVWSSTVVVLVVFVSCFIAYTRIAHSKSITVDESTANALLRATDHHFFFVQTHCDLRLSMFTLPDNCLSWNLSTHRCPGSLLPEPCPPGRFQRSPERSDCAICPRGKFNPDSGQTICQTCPPHTKCPYFGMLSWEMCPLGTYYDVRGNPTDECDTCADDGIARDGE